MNKDLPIGIFDSGIGGLTVANEVKKALPNESILYFGDTEHLPYGEKSAEAIQQFSKQIHVLLGNAIFFPLLMSLGHSWCSLGALLWPLVAS